MKPPDKAARLPLKTLNQEVEHDPVTTRFSMETPSGRAELKYSVGQGRTLDLQHTYVPPAERGKGIGALLVSAALEHARRENLEIIPSCSFVATYLRRHPQYRDLVKRG